MRYIYLLKDPTTKEVVYVGETSNIKKRFDAHKWGSRSNDSKEKLEWAYNLKKLGLEPILEIVDFAKDKNEALIKENKHIVDCLNKNIKLFNIDNTKSIKQYDFEGNLIAEYSSKVVAKKLTGIIPRDKRMSAGGYFWSYDKFDKELVNKKDDWKTVKCKRVAQLDKKGNIIKIFEGVRIACKLTNIDHRSISQVASGSKIRKTAGGFKWQYI